MENKKAQKSNNPQKSAKSKNVQTNQISNPQKKY